MSDYYRLTFEMEAIEVQGAWYLSEVVDQHGIEILETNLITGQPFDLAKAGRVTVLQNVPGTPVDFRLTTLGVPVVSKAFADVVEGFDSNAIQRIPVIVDPLQSGYEILNILDVQQCLDYERTYVERYPADIHPDRAGEVSSLLDIKIIPELVTGHHIFRLGEWKMVIIIVSGELKKALQDRSFMGMKFEAV